MTHKKIKGTHGDVHYWISGRKKETLLFIHGALMDHNIFNDQIGFFSDDYTIIAVDVPWHGRSVPYKSFSLKSAADDIAEILNREDISDVHIIGQSMGGFIAQLIALNQSSPDSIRYRLNVKSLAVLSSSPLQPGYYRNLIALRFECFILSLLPYKFLVKAMAKKISISAKGQSYILTAMEQHSKSKLIEIMIKIPADVLKYGMDIALDTPLLIAYGDKDDSMNIREYCDRWAELEKRELKIIENAAHNANMDNPGMFNSVLKEFLLSHKSAQ